MTKDQAIERLCALVARVNDDHFQSPIVPGCFCRHRELNDEDIRVSGEIIVFIEDAVNAALKIVSHPKKKTPWGLGSCGHCVQDEFDPNCPVHGKR
jgi:hypothetical protein